MISRMALCALVGLGASLLTLPGCSPNKSTDVRAIQIHLSSDPASLDPHQAEDGVALKVLSNTMEGLYSWDANGQVIPALAESHVVSSDDRTYTFKLRSGTRWSDGEAVAADQFVQGFRRALSPGTAGKMADFFSVIKGAKELLEGRGSVDDLAVVANGADTLVITLSEPTPHFLKLLPLATATPFRADLLKDGLRKVTAPTTGAYRIAVYKVGEFLLLEPNSYYWRKGEATPIAFKIVSDETTASRLFQGGQLDVLSRVPALELDSYMSRPGILRTDPFLATYYLGFNHRRPPFDSRAARCAISRSIRRDELVQLLRTGEVVARSWVFPGLEGAISENAPWPKDWPTNHKFGGPVELVFDQSSRNSMLMERVQAQLKEKLKLEVKLTSKDWKSHVASLKEMQADIYRFGWLSPISDPLPHLRVFVSRSLHNYTGWTSKAYDELVDRVSKLSEGAERTALVQKAQEILVDKECVIAPLYHYTQTHAVAPYIENFSVSPFGIIRLMDLKKRSEKN